MHVATDAEGHGSCLRTANRKLRNVQGSDGFESAIMMSPDGELIFQVDSFRDSPEVPHIFHQRSEAGTGPRRR